MNSQKKTKFGKLFKDKKQEKKLKLNSIIKQKFICGSTSLHKHIKFGQIKKNPAGFLLVLHNPKK